MVIACCVRGMPFSFFNRATGDGSGAGSGAGDEKVATTFLAADIVTTQVPVPEHPLPDQPVNVEPPDATAVRVTIVPEL